MDVQVRKRRKDSALKSKGDKCVKRTRLSPPPDDGDVEAAMEGCLEDVIAGDSSDENEDDLATDSGGKDNGEDKGRTLLHEAKAKKSTSLYRPPTHDELQSLKETRDLFGSNLMRLQIDELLSEVRTKKGVTKSLEDFLYSLKQVLTSLPSSEQIDLCDGLTALKKKIHYPLNLDLSNVKGKFQFLPPSGVKVIGGFLLGTLAKPNLHVDIVLHVPMECLQAKDHLNYRYFHKRALFLSLIAGHLRKVRKQLGIKCLQFSATNPLLPVLVLTPEGKSLSKYTICLHTSISDPTYFKKSKLRPDRNNVRRYFLSSLPQAVSSDPSVESSSDSPTPHYNTALLIELGGRERHLHTLYSCMQGSPSLLDAVVLCKVWTRQRKMDKGYGCFSGFHFAMIVAFLLAHKKINKLMSSYQVFRIIVQYISSSDWTNTGPTLAQTDSTLPPLELFHTAFDVVFLDSSGLVNICADISKEMYSWLKHEASLALRYLDDPSTRGFQTLFVTSLSPLLTFDTLCHISPCAVLSTDFIKDHTIREAILLDGAVWPLPLIMSRVLPTLHRGLSNRVKLLTVLPSPPSQWLLSKAPPTPCGDHVTLGLLFDTDHAFSVINMGPPSDSNEAVEFRKFWGQRSELRRFQDGSINEAVMWEGSDSVASRRTICHQIIQHLLERHAGVQMEAVSCTVNALDPLLSLPSSSETRSTTTGEEVAKGVMGVFTELGRDLRQLKNLPLSVTSLQGAAPAFRHTEVFPYAQWNGRLPSKYLSHSVNSQSDCYYPSCDLATPPYVPAHEVICQLESSGKWPDDVEAIEKIKTSFYLYISKALREQCSVISSPTIDYLDVLKDGYVFRIRIHYHREIHLMNDAITMATGPDEASLKKRLSWLQIHLVSLPFLTSSLNGVHQQFPAFSTGARLCKRWVAAQLLSNHISDEALDLMVAYLFVSPAPYLSPGSPLTAFLRFLSLLVCFDWLSEPLVVNFNNELSSSDVSEIVSRFTAVRSTLPPVVIATPTERDHTPWPTPSAPVFSRLRLLAKESLSVLSAQLECPTETDIKQCFRPPLDDYHVIIHLHKEHLPRYEQAVDAMATSSTQQHIRYKHKCTHLPVIDFDPVQKYLQELETSFSEYALFFYNKYGGSYIAVVWKPSAFTPRPFKVMQAHCRVCSDQADKMIPDSEAIVTDFKIIGHGLVKDVEILSLTPL